MTAIHIKFPGLSYNVSTWLEPEDWEDLDEDGKRELLRGFLAEYHGEALEASERCRQVDGSNPREFRWETM